MSAPAVPSPEPTRSESAPPEATIESTRTDPPAASNEPTPRLSEPPPRPSAIVRAFRVLTSPSARLQATGLLTLLAVAAGAALILPPSGLPGDLPEDDALGTIAPHAIKANRDYTIPDPEATAALRQEAARQVRPVYDLDVAAGDETRSRLSQAFAFARDALERDLTDLQAAQKKTKKARDKDAGPSDDDVIALALRHRDGFLYFLQVVVDEAEFKELARARFSEPLERATLHLAQGVLSSEIAPSRELLIAERGSGITVRPVGISPARAEREVREVERLPDAALVRQELLRLAMGLGESPGSSIGVGRLALGLPADLPPGVRRSAATLAARIVGPNLTYNAVETDLRKRVAANAVKPVVLQYARGEKIIGEGERIEKRHLLVFRFVREQARVLDSVQVRLGAALFTVLLVVAVFSLARRTVRRFRPGKRDLVFLAATLLGNLALLRGVTSLCELWRDHLPQLTTEVSAYVLPLAAGTMLVRMLRSGESSVVFALIFSPLAALQLGQHGPAAMGLVASVVAAERLGRRTGRLSLPIAAVQAAVAAALVVAALALFGGRLLPETAMQAGAAAIGTGLLSPLAAALVAPIFEAIFGYTSESQLSTLASLNHPVLKELIIKAPGTYHHSLIVGALAEAAARKVDAHPLMARVGGYYHDLGKADSPLFFGENQKGDNRLEKLPPEQAAEMLHRHVLDGVARAQAARLPKAVQDVIVQHHGTRLAGGFYLRAREQAEREGRPQPPEALFRYAGPKPRSREVALVMLADAVESATRTLVDPSPERLQALVPKVVEPMVLEGQLDECDLTLADVHRVIAAFQQAIVEVHGLPRIEPLPRPAARIG